MASLLHLTEAEVVVIILGVAVGFLLLLAFLIYCTFRVRNRVRLKRGNFPVYVLPSPRSSEDSGIIPEFVDKNWDEGVKLKRYSPFKNGDFAVRWSKKSAKRRKLSQNDDQREGVANLSYEEDNLGDKVSDIRVPNLPDDTLAIELEDNMQRRSKVFSESKNTLKYLAIRNSFLRKSPEMLSENDNDQQPIPSGSEMQKSEQNLAIAGNSIGSDGTKLTILSDGSVTARSAEIGEDVDSKKSFYLPPPPVIKSQHKLRRDLAEAIASDQVSESSVQFSVPLNGNNGTLSISSPSPIFWLDRFDEIPEDDEEHRRNSQSLDSAHFGQKSWNNDAGKASMIVNSSSARNSMSDQMLSSVNQAAVDVPGPSKPVNFESVVLSNGNAGGSYGGIVESYCSTPPGRATSPVEVICKQRTAV